MNSIGLLVDARKGGEQFHHFTNMAISWFRRPHSRTYWFQSVFPASQRYEAILTACLCFSIVFTSPLDRTVSLALPPKAIAWYCESLATQQDKFELIIMASSLYLQIEARFLHYENMDNLLRAALAIIHANRMTILNFHLHDSVMSTLINEVLDSMESGSGDPRLIPKEHWMTLITLALRMAAEANASQAIILGIELINLQFDLECGGFGDPRLELRMVNWCRRLDEYRSSLDAMSPEKDAPKALELHFIHAQATRYYYRWQICGDAPAEQLMISNMSQALVQFEHRRDISKSQSPFANIMMDVVFIRRAVFIAWYWREEPIVDRLTNILLKYKHLMTYYDKVISYLEVLVQTPHGVPTELEKQVFGPSPPKVLCRWQLYRLSNELARP